MLTLPRLPRLASHPGTEGTIDTRSSARIGPVVLRADTKESSYADERNHYSLAAVTTIRL